MTGAVHPATGGEPSALARAVDRLVQPPTRAVVLTFLSLYPAVMILLATRLGPGITPDSVVYVSAARNLVGTGKLIDYLGEPLTLWPPGFPLLLSLFERVGVDSQSAAIGINVVSAVLTVVLTYALAAVALESKSLGVLAAAIVATSASTVRVYSMLWTEPLFAVLTLGALLLLTRAVRAARFTPGLAVAVAVVVSGATLTRIAGLWLVPIAALGALLSQRSRGPFRALGWALSAGLLSSIGFVLVVMRNLAAGRPPLGERYAAGLTLRGLISSSLETLGRYVIPPLSSLELLAGLLVAGLLLTGLLGVAHTRSLQPAVISGFIGLYWVSLWFSQVRTGIDATSERLLAPIFPSMVILLILGARGVLNGAPRAAIRDGERRSPSPFVRVVWVGSVSLLLAAVLTGLGSGGVFAVRSSKEGLGYNNLSELASPLAQAVKELPASAGVAADDFPKMYWVSGRTSITVIPWTGYYFPPAKAARENQILVERIRSGEVSYLADFYRLDTVLTAQSMAAAGCDTTKVGDFNDGTLWRVSRC